MSDEVPIPEMRPVAMSLLVVATGDTRTLPENLDLVHNAALRYSLEIVADAPRLARDGAQGFAELLGSTASQPEFFLWLGCVLDAIDRRVRGRHEALHTDPHDAPTSYDHAALLGLGQTLSTAARVSRGEFPALSTALARIAKAAPRKLQESLVANYLGNLFVDYFDGSQVRARMSSLPAEFEQSFRTEEATDLARTVFALANGGSDLAPIPDIQRHLRTMIANVWFAEKQLGD